MSNSSLMFCVKYLLKFPREKRLEVIRSNLVGVELIRNFIPQKNKEGIVKGFRLIGESFLPIPFRI